ATQAAVDQKLAKLTQAFAQALKRREGAEPKAGEYSERRRQELEAEVTQNKQEQTRLRQELEQVQKQLQAVKESQASEQKRLEGRTQELQTAHGPVEEKIKSLTEAL